MTATTLAARYVGKQGTLAVDEQKGVPGFIIPVEVTDVREAYGRVDVFVIATTASGGKWVSADRVRWEA